MGGTVASGLLAYVSITIAARLLNPVDFGLLGALIALSSFATILLRPAGFAMTHLAATAYVDVGGGRLRGLGAASVALSAVVMVLLVLLVAAFGQPLATTLQASSTWPIWLLVPLLGALTCFHLTNGILTGAQRFVWFAGAGVIEAAARAIVTAPLVLHIGVSGSLGSYVAGHVAAIAFSITCLGGLAWKPPPVKDVIDAVRTGSAALTLLVGISLLQNGDLVLLRWYGRAEDAGLYAACATIGGLLVTLGTPLFVPAFPRALAAHRSGEPTLPILLFALTPIVVGGISASLASIWLGSTAVGLLFGPAFEGAGLILPVYLAKSTALLAAGVLGQHAIATGRLLAVRLAVVPAACTLVMLGYLRPDAVATALVAVAGGVVLSIVIGMPAVLGARVRSS
jgi:O-antigen/teichoic acid export membrane protein